VSVYKWYRAVGALLSLTFFYLEGEENMREFTEQELVRREKAKYLESLGIDPFGQRFDVTSDSKTIKELYGDKTTEELEELNVPVVIAGRIMTKRGKGKAGFINLQDKYGQIQVYVKLDNIGEEAYRNG